MTSLWPSKVSVTDCRRRRAGLRGSNSENGEETDIEMWPESEYAELRRSATRGGWHADGDIPCVELAVHGQDIGGGDYVEGEGHDGGKKAEYWLGGI